jgi:hypothetical protein
MKKTTDEAPEARIEVRVDLWEIDEIGCGDTGWKLAAECQRTPRYEPDATSAVSALTTSSTVASVSVRRETSALLSRHTYPDLLIAQARSYGRPAVPR